MKNIFYRDVWRNVIARRDNEATFECCIPIRVANLFPKSGGFSIYLCLALIANPPPIQIRQLKFLPSHLVFPYYLDPSIIERSVAIVLRLFSIFNNESIIMLSWSLLLFFLLPGGAAKSR